MTEVKKTEAAAIAKTADAGRIVVGASFKLLPPAKVRDTGRIRTGASFALLSAR